jgi:ribosomal protein S18 acetylase RimI-like enzyme
MTAAEDRLRMNAALKVQLMVRSGNESVLGFYQQIDYEEARVVILSRWISAER